MSLRKLGRYEIVRVLGKGAMGVVYEGRDPNLDRHVAIKTVKVENLAPEAAAEYEARFRTEARSAARLQHPNIVSVYDSDRHEDVAFLVMEYVQGDDLKHHLDAGERYALEQTLRMMDDLLSALDYAHRHGVVHRDIKPANLLLEPSGRLKLTDFGVARLQEAGDATRTQGAMVGTLKYMAPEQVQGQRVDARADLFSVGVVLYQLLTDQRPFGGDNEFEIIQQIIGRAPPPPSSIDARLPTAIDAVVARALAKRPDDRFATAAEFATALRAAMRQVDDPTIVPPANPHRTQPGMFQSVTSPGTSPMGGSTVTQELELVYWKDVKDSNDPEDLQVFLSKFPSGIYAELARRRLRKLASEPAPDQTVLSGMDRTAPPLAGSRPGALEFIETTPTLPVPRDPTLTQPLPMRPGAPSRSAAATPAQHASGPASAVEATTVPLAREATPAAPAPEPRRSLSAGEEEDDATSPPRAPRRKALLAGVAALAVAGLAAVLIAGRGGREAPTAAQDVAPAAPAVTTTAAPAAQPAPPAPSAPTVHASMTAHTAREHAAAASAPHAQAALARGKTKQVAKAPSVPAPSTPAATDSPRPAPEPMPAAEPREQARAAPAPRVTAGSPVDACKDKVFLALEFCLAEQCDKPGARNHPLCVKRREEARVREESRIRN